MAGAAKGPFVLVIDALGIMQMPVYNKTLVLAYPSAQGRKSKKGNDPPFDLMGKPSVV